MKLLSTFCLTLTLMLLTGCPDNEIVAKNPVGVDAWLPLKINEVAIEVQIPVSRSELQRGLMHRDELPADGGMLFPYPEPQRMSFWMANTRIPLDIGFFNAQGRLLEIHRMVPFDTSRTTSRSDQVQFALEMNSGWFASKGLLPGAQIDLPLLKANLRARGVDPTTYSLP